MMKSCIIFVNKFWTNYALDLNVMALKIVVRFGHFSGWMNCFDSMIWLLIRGFVLPVFIRYFCDKYSDLFEIVSGLKDSYLASTSLLRLPEGHPRAISTAFL